MCSFFRCGIEKLTSAAFQTGWAEASAHDPDAEGFAPLELACEPTISWPFSSLRFLVAGSSVVSV
jgi:hypothetical protein